MNKETHIFLVSDPEIAKQIFDWQWTEESVVYAGTTEEVNKHMSKLRELMDKLIDVSKPVFVEKLPKE